MIVSKEARETRTELARAKATPKVTETMAGHRKMRASAPWATTWSDGADMQVREIHVVEKAAAAGVCGTAVCGNFESKSNHCRVVLRGWRSWSAITYHRILALQQCGNRVLLLNPETADCGCVVW